MQVMFALITGLHASGYILTESAPNVTAFANSPGLLFENLGNVHLFAAEWKLVIYYDLSNYQTEFSGFQTCLDKIRTLCTTVTNIKLSNCNIFLKQFENHLHDITNIHELLFSHSQNRNRRSLTDAGGYALNYAFGLQDQHSAVKYNEQISYLQLDQNYLLNLIRNQTLIVDSTAHILFNNKKHVEDHH